MGHCQDHLKPSLCFKQLSNVCISRLCSAKKITGQVLKVDGGKTLTSRGQADWYGWQYMNRRFEQESTTSYLNYRVYKESMKPMPKND